MKILVYSPLVNFLVGGGEVYSLNQAKYLALLNKYQINIAVVRTDREIASFKNYTDNNNVKPVYIASEIMRGLKLDYSDLTNFDNVYKFYYSISRGFLKLCTENHYDLIISHCTLANIQIPSNIKLFSLLHGVPDQKDGLNEVAINLPDKRFAVSKSVAAGWKKLYGEHLVIDLLPNAVEKEKYHKIDGTNEDIDIFFIGRLIEIKGVQYLIKSVAQILNNDRGLIRKVVIAGSGPYETELIKLTVELNLDRIVDFVGRVSDEELNNYYNRSKVCVFPSYAREGVLTTMLEAASANRAIVTTNCCGMVDFAVDGVNSLLCEPQNTEDLANKISRLLLDRNLRSKLANQAASDIENNWTWDKSILRLAKVIDEL